MIPYANNPRLHSEADLEKIAASIRRWGWTNPVLVDEQGVLILSQFTGAARELHDALPVNPYHGDQCAEAIYRALTMPPDEQRVRMRSMRRVVAEFNVYHWAGAMLLDAARLRQRNRVSQRIVEHQREAPPEFA